MEKLIKNRNKSVDEIMKYYIKRGEDFLKDVQSILDCELKFKENIKEKISPKSYENALNDFIDETSRIEKKLVSEKMKYNEVLNEFLLKDTDFSSSVLTKTRKQIFDKDEVENKLKELCNEFDTKYENKVNDYNSKLDELFDKIKKSVEVNQKFVVEYGDIQVNPNKPAINEYRPIYDVHNKIYKRFIFDFEVSVREISVIPQTIKLTYSTMFKLLDEHYDLFDEFQKFQNELNEDNNE